MRINLTPFFDLMRFDSKNRGVESTETVRRFISLKPHLSVCVCAHGSVVVCACVGVLAA